MSDKQTIPLSTVKELLQQQREDFSSMITSLMNSFNVRYDKLHSTVTEIKVSLEFSQKDIESLKEAIKQQDLSQKALANEASIAQEDLKEISNNIDYLENQSRRNNVVFDGIAEQSKETWVDSENKVLKILKDNMQLEALPIERAHRVGRPKPQKNRAVVVKFLNFKDRETVLRSGKKLRGTSIFVREDLSEKVLAKRRAQMHLLKEAREGGKIAYFNYDRLVIKERQPSDSLFSGDVTIPPQEADHESLRRTTRSHSALKS